MRACRYMQTMVLLWSFGSTLHAQEGAGQAEMSFQQYYLAIGAERIANISGVGLSFSQFVPDVGLVSGSILPATSNSHFRTGDSFLKLKGLPWRGQHWTFTAGDFRLAGTVLPSPFTNVSFSEIAARGGALEATHGTRTFGFFFGQETISNTPRVVLRQQVPQILLGAYWKQSIGTRLLFGARLMHFSNDLQALRQQTNFLSATPLTQATSLSLTSLYSVAGPLKMYGEASWSMAAQEGANHSTRSAPLSVLTGPVLDTRLFTFRANYTFQNASYFPLLGYYLGDREGPFAEVKYRPFEGTELYGSASEYENNIAKDPTLATFRNSSESAGFSTQLPGRITVNAQITKLDLSTRANAASLWIKSADQQKSVTVARSFSHHNVRLTGRDFTDVSPLNSQRQRSAEIEDNFHVRRLTLGGGLRVQRLSAAQSRTSLFYRGSAQFQMRRLSAYANFETGNDLQNRTLLATNTVSTTVIGASATAGKSWEFQAEAYRNNLLTELNPQSIFVLQGQGVFIPGTLAALNQWSIYFRLSKRFQWGTTGDIVDLAQYAARRTTLNGVVEGFVMERLASGNQPAEGVTVSIDEALTAVTDADGHFRFPQVAEGRHKVGLALHELPAEFDVGKTIESSLVVLAGKPTRADLDVVRLGTIRGAIKALKKTELEGIVVRMQPGERYTTPDADGSFYFYNVPAGSYTLTLDEKTFPEFATVTGPKSVTVSLGASSEATQVPAFLLDIQKPEKPVRNVLEKK